MLGLSVWKGLRMRITSRPDRSANFCTNVAISSTDLQWMLSSRTAPLTGKREIGEGGRRRAGVGRRGPARLAQVPPLAPGPAALTVFGHHSGHAARSRVHVYYYPWVAPGEVDHLPFHELPEGPEKGEFSDPARGDLGRPSPPPDTPSPAPPRAHLAPRDEGASRLRLKLRRCSCGTYRPSPLCRTLVRKRLAVPRAVIAGAHRARGTMPSVGRRD